MESVVYQNHRGEEFGNEDYKILIPTSSLRDYEWEYTERSNVAKVKKIKRKLREIDLQLYIFTKTEKENAELKNKLYEIVEEDIISMQEGKLYLNDYYLSGYIMASKKKILSKDPRYSSIGLTFVSDGMWTKDIELHVEEQIPEETRTQNPATIKYVNGSTPKELPKGVMYPDFKYEYFKEGYNTFYAPQYDYPHDYIKVVGKYAIVNSGFGESDFTLTIWGTCTNPLVMIGNNTYQVNTILTSGERLVIDSKKKTIEKIDLTGGVVNCFNDRNKSYNIFQKIPEGTVPVVYNARYAIDLVVYEERSEPKWIF
jgi:hypothetical protein